MLFSPFCSKRSGDIEAFIPNVIERHLFDVMNRALSAANIVDSLNDQQKEKLEMDLFFVDWMRAEDRPTSSGVNCTSATTTSRARPRCQCSSTHGFCPSEKGRPYLGTYESYCWRMRNSVERQVQT